MSKSHVGIAIALCPICLSKSDEAIALDKRLKPTLKKENFMGWKFCDSCQDHLNKGFVALIETTNPKSNAPESEGRTGNMAFIKKEAFTQIFRSNPTQITFIEVGVLQQLQEMTQHES